MRVRNFETGRWVRGLLLCAALALVGACSTPSDAPAVVPLAGSTTVAILGAEGGVLEIEDLLVTVPPGAVAPGTEIRVIVDAPRVDGVFTMYSPVIRFEPAGLELARPIEVRIPFRGDSDLANVFTERSGGGAFVPRTTEVEGDVAVAQVRYLASTFVGSACEGEECTCAPIGMLDLLLVVDDSASMAEEQALIQAQLPGLFRALATGDLDGDGVQDVAAFDSIRVGVTTTDMGTGSASGVQTCEAGLGNDGILRSERGLAAPTECTDSSYASPISEYAAASPSGLDGFVAQIACTAATGTTGCGFEQQLEAALTALSPNAPTAYTADGWTVPSGVDGRMGQGDLANAGFLRDDSILAVLFLTDEEDCSVSDSGLFDIDDPRYAGVDLNLRCHAFGEAVQPVSRFVDGLLGLRRRPEDVVVAALVGAPVGVAMPAGAIDYASLLAADEMIERIDPTLPNRLLPVCTSENGQAYPARRILQTLEGIDEAGGRVVLQSICDPTFEALTQGLATQLGERASGGC